MIIEPGEVGQASLYNLEKTNALLQRPHLHKEQSVLRQQNVYVFVMIMEIAWQCINMMMKITYILILSIIMYVLKVNN